MPARPTFAIVGASLGGAKAAETLSTEGLTGASRSSGPNPSARTSDRRWPRTTTSRTTTRQRVHFNRQKGVSVQAAPTTDLREPAAATRGVMETC